MILKSQRVSAGKETEFLLRNALEQIAALGTSPDGVTTEYARIAKEALKICE
jgi:hypothetical protein